MISQAFINCVLIICGFFCGNMCIPKNFNSVGRNCKTELCIFGKMQHMFFNNLFLCTWDTAGIDLLAIVFRQKHNLYTFAQCTHFVCTYHVLFYLIFIFQNWWYMCMCQISRVAKQWKDIRNGVCLFYVWARWKKKKKSEYVAVKLKFSYQWCHIEFYIDENEALMKMSGIYSIKVLNHVIFKTFKMATYIPHSLIFIRVKK